MRLNETMPVKANSENISEKKIRIKVYFLFQLTIIRCPMFVIVFIWDVLYVTYLITV